MLDMMLAPCGSLLSITPIKPKANNSGGTKHRLVRRTTHRLLHIFNINTSQHYLTEGKSGGGRNELLIHLGIWSSSQLAQVLVQHPGNSQE